MSPRKPSKRRPAQRAKGRIILVLGGASSGKSEAALPLAGSRRPRAFVATGQGLDDEMAVRIARHQATRRPIGRQLKSRKKWRRGLPSDLGPRYRTILFDCVTLWLSNLVETGLKESVILARAGTLLQRTLDERAVKPAGFTEDRPLITDGVPLTTND